MDDRYRPSIQFLHWLIALTVIGLVIAGLLLHYDLIPRSVHKPLAFLHMSFGLAILALMVVRLFIRRRTGVPELPEEIGRPFRIAAHTTQILFYALLLAMPVFGILFVEAHGRKVPFFGLFTLPAFVGKNHGVQEVFAFLHFWGGIAVILLLIAHVGGAVRHELRGERMIRRMLPGRRST